jgi:UDP-N-acetylglucosamine diphosphorylase/glucosamine-1-phosphate N-acetyltransferase
MLVAAWVPGAGDTLPADVLDADALTPETFGTLPAEEVTGATLVRHPWDLLSTLRPALHRDFTARTGRYNILEDIYERRDTTVHPSAIGVNPEQIYLAPGATIQPGAVLNAADGPIYVGRGATVHEQAVVRGPLYLGPKAQVKGGANVEGSAIGYWSKVGGEVHDSVIQSLSNKSHAGFLGHAYLGRWCNLGADTNNSNLKNDYGDVAAYDVAAGETVSTGRQFAGLFMGDHSKCGINTMFNTGTVVGTFCNIYGGDFPPRYVPSFSWGTPRDGFADYRLDKALEVADAVMQRRERRPTDAQRALLTELFDATAAERARMHG